MHVFLKSCNEHISYIAKSISKKLVFLFRSRIYFTPTQVITLYKAPCPKYETHLLIGNFKHFLYIASALQIKPKLIHL